MPNKHASPFVGWNPPGDRSAWLRAEAERRGVPLSTVLNEAVDEYRESRERQRRAGVTMTGTERAPNCKCLMCKPEGGKR